MVPLKVRFETQNRMSDCIVSIDEELYLSDEELEEGRLEKLDKRVRELETDLPELIAEITYFQNYVLSKIRTFKNT